MPLIKRPRVLFREISGGILILKRSCMSVMQTCHRSSYNLTDQDHTGININADPGFFLKK